MRLIAVTVVIDAMYRAEMLTKIGVIVVIVPTGLGITLFSLTVDAAASASHPTIDSRLRSIRKACISCGPFFANSKFCANHNG